MKDIYMTLSVAVALGFCSESLANKLPGPIHHARWLTKACRVLRLYVSSNKPTKNLVGLVTYIMQVYVPTFFNIKFHKSCTYGSIHFFNLIKLSRNLPSKHFAIIKQVCNNNSYFAHSENVLLLSMIFDNDPAIRRIGYTKIIHSRENSTQSLNSLRGYCNPKINFDCEKYIDLISWDTFFTEPPFTRSKTIPKKLQF